MLNASYVTGNAGVGYLSLRLPKKGIKILFFRTWGEATPRAGLASDLSEGLPKWLAFLELKSPKPGMRVLLIRGT